MSYPHPNPVRVKKIDPIVDNFSESEKKRRGLIIEIQRLYRMGHSIREISRITEKERRTVKKYLVGDPDILCRSNRRSPLEVYTDYIIKSIIAGQTASAIARQLKDNGCECTITNLRNYITTIADKYGLERTKYCRSAPKYDEEGKKKPKMDYITRKGIFNYLWMNGDLTSDHRNFLWQNHDELPELEKCIKEFREIFDKKNMSFLYLFIERYQMSIIKEIASFAKGLAKDIEAVENAVSSPFSNGFVEGTNSKVKTIKKTMYGRCGKRLLEAKLMYEKSLY